MRYSTQQDVLDFVEDNNVKFVRFAFCDIFGTQKNIAVLASDLPKAMEDGVCFDGSSIAGFMNTEESDLVLWPDPDTMTILPWRPTEGRVMRMYCDITLPNGRPFAGNSRGYLQSVVKRAKAMGLRESRIAFRHILPNIVSVIFVTLTLDFATCMLTESTLSYLGFGVTYPRPTWGNMLNGANNSTVIKNFWWRWLFPAIFLAITCICINIVGDTLRDVMDPKSDRDK